MSRGHLIIGITAALAGVWYAAAVTRPAAHATTATPAAPPSIAGQLSLEASGLGFRTPDLSRSVVYLAADPRLETKPLPRSEHAISQRNKRFIPDFLVVSLGTSVEFPNWDQFSHNVFSRSAAAPPFDLDRYPYGQSKSYTFTKIGVVQIFCNIHPHMRATVVAVPNPYFARADTEGRFALHGLPEGRFELVGWHHRYDEARVPVEIDSGGTFTVEMRLERSTAKATDGHPRKRRADYGVARGLGLKREKLTLPVVGGAHPARSSAPSRSPPAAPTRDAAAPTSDR